jgi:hypothetical protein
VHLENIDSKTTGWVAQQHSRRRREGQQRIRRRPEVVHRETQGGTRPGGWRVSKRCPELRNNYCTRARLRHQRQPSNTANPAITKSKEDGTGVAGGGGPKPSGCGLPSDWACAASAPMASQTLTVARLTVRAIRCNCVPNVGCVWDMFAPECHRIRFSAITCEHFRTALVRAAPFALSGLPLKNAPWRNTLAKHEKPMS